MIRGTNLLSIDVGWGSGNGFTDLTGPATAAHIHIAPDNDFGSNGGVLINLGGILDSDAANGGINGSVDFDDLADTAAGVQALMDGNLYINVHTAANGGGEIRGNLVNAIPEPSTIGLLGIGLGALVLPPASQVVQNNQPCTSSVFLVATEARPTFWKYHPRDELTNLSMPLFNTGIQLVPHFFQILAV